MSKEDIYCNKNKNKNKNIGKKEKKVSIFLVLEGNQGY